MVDPQTTAGARTDGLKTALDILIAPGDAFHRIRLAPTWRSALLVSIAFAILATLAIAPALKHAMELGLPAQLAATPAFAKLPPADQQKQIAAVMAVQLGAVAFSWIVPIIVLPIVAAIQSLVMFAANAVARGDGSFKRLWSLAINAQIVATLCGVLGAAIILLRGTGSFDRPEQLQTVLPSLALLVPGAPHVLAAVLNALNVAALWQTVILALGMTATANIARPVAWTAALLMLLTACTFAAAGALAQVHAG